MVDPGGGGGLSELSAGTIFKFSGEKKNSATMMR